MRELIVYTDGSYVKGNDYCGYAAVILEPEKTPFVIFGSISNPKYVSSWNVGGEIKAAEIALEYALEHHYDSLHIYHDYIGISQWVIGSWKRNKDLTKDYYKAMKLAMENLKISFTHVKSHSGDEYNEIADKYASKCPKGEVIVRL